MTEGKLVFLPKGYRIVPEEPTREQMENCGPIEGYEYGRKTADRDHSVWYTAMVKEAPQLTTPPVLRWEGNLLYVGNEVIGRIHKFKNEWSSDPSNSARLSATEQEARRAAEKALGFPDGLVVEEV